MNLNQIVDRASKILALGIVEVILLVIIVKVGSTMIASFTFPTIPTGYSVAWWIVVGMTVLGIAIAIRGALHNKSYTGSIWVSYIFATIAVMLTVTVVVFGLVYGEQTPQKLNEIREKIAAKVDQLLEDRHHDGVLDYRDGGVLDLAPGEFKTVRLGPEKDLTIYNRVEGNCVNAVPDDKIIVSWNDRVTVVTLKLKPGLPMQNVRIGIVPEGTYGCGT